MTSTGPSRAACPSAGAEPVFRLFACCVPVRGARRSLICDLQRQTWRFIPNSLYEILTEHGGKGLAAIEEHYGHRHDAEIERYFAVLEEEDLGFWCDEPESFPPLDLGWEAPERITHAIVDVDARSAHDYSSIFAQLDDLGCKALQVRAFQPLPREEIERLLLPTVRGRLRSIELLLAHAADLTDEWLTDLCRRHPRIGRITVHSTPAAAPAADTAQAAGSTVRVERCIEAIDSPACCGCVDPSWFAPNLAAFLEAQRHNSCLNRKLAVDARGEIRNCPSLGRSFGNVREVSLHSAVLQRDFSALWEINKDQVEVCRDCEFRYICTDCRAYLSRPDDLYSKPAKCGYDPYAARWRGAAGQESGAPASS
jgi:SPASM domain peptide maturase of grasp-with-spasm system